MEDIFISYSKPDVDSAKELARLLTSSGLSVWWDNLLSPGDFFGDVITDKIGKSKIVLVLWTEHSIHSKWVHAEASLALSQNKLVPVKDSALDFNVIPLPFNTLHTIDIANAGEITSLIAQKLDISEQVRHTMVKRKQKNKYVRIAYVASPIVCLIVFSVGYYFLPGFRDTVFRSFNSIKAYFHPCSGINIQIGNNAIQRDACVSSNVFEDFTFRDCENCPQMVVIPEGRYHIGSPDTEIGRDLDEEPQKEISLKAFSIGKYEITKAQWNKCVDDGVCRHRPEHTQVTTGNHPISYISWIDANTYTLWLSKKTNKLYRLPTEAEWEYAARAGIDAPRYWGFKSSEACKYANVGDINYERALDNTKNISTLSIREIVQNQLTFGEPHKCDDRHNYLSEVGNFKPNNYQLFDMIGNVWEWVEDCAFPNYEAIPNDGTAYHNEDCRISNLRGGSYTSGPANARSANRFQGGKSKDQFQPDYGFRVVRELSHPSS